MSEDKDINTQYELVFGKTERPNVYDSDDEEYNSLRQEIIDAKREFNSGRKLPFVGIKLLSYEDFRRDEIVQKASMTGNRIFFIRKYEGTKLVVYAAAYFNLRDSAFIVLRESFCRETNYFTYINDCIPVSKRYAFRSSFIRKDGFLLLKETKIFDSASVAASCFLGKKTTYKEWHDERGKTLDAYFAKYKSETIDSAEEKTFPDHIESEPFRGFRNHSFTELHPNNEFTPKFLQQPQTQSHILDIVNRLQGNNNSKHLFYLHEEAICNAFGYFDSESNYFYICKDSLVSYFENPNYKNTTSSQDRKRFLDESCQLEFSNRFYYKVKKDAMCKSASAAACYVLGRNATHTLWRDARGKLIKDIYPNNIFNNDEDNTPSKHLQISQSNSTLRIFYLKRDSHSERMCNVSGYYDTITQKFVVRAGSIFSLSSALSYEYTASGIARKQFLNKYCSKEKTGYKLKKDYIFDAPSIAASYALGRSANGWLEFKDVNNVQLDSVYR